MDTKGKASAPPSGLVRTTRFRDALRQIRDGWRARSGMVFSFGVATQGSRRHGTVLHFD